MHRGFEVAYRMSEANKQGMGDERVADIQFSDLFDRRDRPQVRQGQTMSCIHIQT
jgi:hypothetical protein